MQPQRSVSLVASASRPQCTPGTALSALYLHWASPQGLSALVPWLVAAQPSRTYGLSTQGETTLWGPVPHASPVPGPGLPPHLPSLYAVLPAPHPNTPLTAPSPSLPPHPSSAPSQGMQQRTGLCSWCEGPAPSLFITAIMHYVSQETSCQTIPLPKKTERARVDFCFKRSSPLFPILFCSLGYFRQIIRPLCAPES